MTYTEIQDKKGTKYYYRTFSIREKNGFRKVRKYLGKDLTKQDLKKKEAEADKELTSLKERKFKIEELKLYKQSGAGYACTIGLPMNFIFHPAPIEPNFTITYPGDMTYASADFQFFHFFDSERTKPVADELFSRLKQNPDWVKLRINEFEKAINGMEEVCEEMVKCAENIQQNTKNKIIKAYEKFLEKNYSYWIPSLFIDILDTYEEDILNYIFGSERKNISKEDMQVILLPNKSIYWSAKEDFNKIKEFYVHIGREKANEELWNKLKKYAEKYWWLQNDYQNAKKMTASDFSQTLDEHNDTNLNEMIKIKKRLIEKYGFDREIISRLEQFSDIAYFRDIRKKITQIVNYYVITFYHTVARKHGLLDNLSNFVVPYVEYKKFINKDAGLIKILEERTKKGVWMISDSVAWRPKIETKRAEILLKEIEKKFADSSILYGNTASLGKVTGTAKIILRQSDFSKFSKGDILITGMTRPEFVPLMKIAAAIVTDEGGVTSHAAIISRELQKPCLIATRSATKNFRDGDLLEVNANHGYVKIIKKA